MQIIMVGAKEPVTGEGQLWRVVEGDPGYLLLVDVPDGKALDGSSWGSGADLWTGRQVFPGDLGSPTGAGALLVVSQEPVEGAEQDFNDWMDQEHVPGLGSVPGVLAARRYEAISGTPRYSAVYHAESPDVLTSDAWKKAGGTEWSARMRGRTQGRVRIVAVPAS